MLRTREYCKDINDGEHLFLQGQRGADLPRWASHHNLTEDYMTTNRLMAAFESDKGSNGVEKGEMDLF